MFLKRYYWVGVFGNVLDHYDTNLYGFMAPFLAPLFFPNQDPVVQLILAYGLLSASVVSRPLGAFVFGIFARHIHPQYCLAFSLIGVALSTGAMGCIPTYEVAGVWAPVFLATLRALQGFFGGGESCIAGLCIVGSMPKHSRGWYGGLYQSSTVIGILLASVAVWGIGGSTLQNWWRLPFLIGLLAGICGVVLRFLTIEVVARPTAVKKSSWGVLLRERKLIVRIAFVSGFSYLTYVLPFVFLNGFVPLITHITRSEMLALNTAVLFLDAALCPFLGRIADRFPIRRFMASMVIALALFSIPAFLMLPHANLFLIGIIRVVIVLIGLGFLAPMYAWFLQELPDRDEKYLIKGFAANLGTELLGRSMPALCMAIWYMTGSLALVGTYPAFLALLALAALYWPQGWSTSEQKF